MRSSPWLLAASLAACGAPSTPAAEQSAPTPAAPPPAPPATAPPLVAAPTPAPAPAELPAGTCPPCQAAELAALPQPIAGPLFGDGDAVYWVDPGGIARARLPGGPREALASGAHRPQLALGPDSVFACAESSEAPALSLVRVPKAGGEPSVLAELDAAHCVLAADAGAVYYAAHERSSGEPALYRLSLEPGATPQRLARGVPVAAELAVDAEHLYWSAAAARRIARKPVAGGKWEYFTGTRGAPRGLQLAGADVLWSDGDHVLRRPKSGGDPVELGDDDGVHAFGAGAPGVAWPSGQAWTLAGGEAPRRFAAAGRVTAAAIAGEHVAWISAAPPAVRALPLCGCGPEMFAGPAPADDRRPPSWHIGHVLEDTGKAELIAADLLPRERDNLGKLRDALAGAPVPAGHRLLPKHLAVGQRFTLVRAAGGPEGELTGFALREGPGGAPVLVLQLDVPALPGDPAVIAAPTGALPAAQTLRRPPTPGPRLQTDALAALPAATEPAPPTIGAEHLAVAVGSFPPPHAALVHVAAPAPDAGAPWSALYFVDILGRPTHTVLPLARREASIHAAGLVDLDLDGYDEVALELGGREALLRWDGAAPLGDFTIAPPAAASEAPAAAPSDAAPSDAAPPVALPTVLDEPPSDPADP